MTTSLSRVPQEIPWFLALGVPVQGYLAVPQSYSSARELLSYSIIMPPNVCIDAATEHCYLPPKILKELNFSPLANLLDSGDTVYAQSVINHFFSELESYLAHSPEHRRAILLQALKLIFDTKDKNYWLQNLDLPNLYELLNQRNLLNIRQDISRISMAYMHYRKELGANTQPVAERIMQYLEQNYEKDLSLKTIAVDLHYTPAYLGKIFKQEYSQLFSEYLCNFRIEKAKRLLMKGAYKLNEIAIMTGFKNSNYFSSVFKRIVGVSPSQFRNTFSDT